MLKKLLFILLLFLKIAQSIAQPTNFDIRLNQVGYLPNALKLAVIVEAPADSFCVMTSDLQSVVFKGQCLPSAYDVSSGENVRIADFSLLQKPGEYVLVVEALGKSVPFSINKNVYTNLSKASIKAFYYNRASIEIEREYAGIYAREMGHPDNAVVVLPSAASASRPAGSIISTPGGWYDAGDYNKYIVNSGISVFTLLSAYETYPEYFDTLNLNIPESNNSIPDILDEALWNIRWMMTMQDADDGGIYHKTTEAQFSSFAMPSQVNSTRYVTAKSTAATLDFAAIMAMTARIYKPYLPKLADTALAQSVKAYLWAKNHPDVPYTNPSASEGYPEIGSGEYGDKNITDEFSWCASELYITTGDSGYYNEIGLDGILDIPGWGNVKTLGLLSLLVHKDSLLSESDIAMISEQLIGIVKKAKSNIITSAYRIPGDFYYWGGNNAYSNLGMLFMQVFKLTKNASCFNAALSSLDYLLGKNATSYCFVTGTGTKHPMNIHHRISGSDGIAEPIPGLLVGGPGTGSVSDCGASQYPSTFPAKSYADLLCSYSTNEIAINWNAPLAFLAGAIQSEYLENFLDSMPSYFNISTTGVSLPYKKANGVQVAVEGNANWSLLPSDDWISISATEGIGSGVITINSMNNNPDVSARTGKIYVYNQATLTDSIVVAQNGIRKSFRLEAEDYTNMSGLQTETTLDVDGGVNIGYVEIGDWATYSIDITNAGVYDVTFRYAGYAGNFDIYIDDSLLQQITFPATSDWQDWSGYTAKLILPEGQHELKLKFNAAGPNFNWFQFDWIGLPGDLKQVYNNVRVYPIQVNTYLRVDFGAIKSVGLIQTGRSLLSGNFEESDGENPDVSGFKRVLIFLT